MGHQLRPGTRVRVIQQIPQIDRVWTTVLEGTVVSFRQVQTGAWFAHGKDHKFWLDRLEVRTDDGEIIYMSYTGVVSRGENGLYWRVRPIFQTASEKYDWLNHTVFIGKNKQVPGKVAYDIFRIL